ncbi:uncharacterized protein P7C70_g6853, partial [Phenoliferia sp. Uapishka_3]
MKVSFTPSVAHPWAWFPTGTASPTPPTISPDGAALSFKTVPKTDWWRTPGIWNSDGLAYVVPVRAEAGEGKELDMEASVKIQGEWQVQCLGIFDSLCRWKLVSSVSASDQAALFLRFSDSLWIKTGIEFTEGQSWASVVITNRWSDWSLLPIPTESSLPLKFSFRLKGHHLEVFLGEMMIREVNGFAIDASELERKSGAVGVMGCSPKNESGTMVSFQDFELRAGGV